MTEWKAVRTAQRALVLAGLAMWVVACGGGGDGGTAPAPAPPSVATVTVTLAQSSVVVGGGTSAAASLRDASGASLSNRTIVWTSSNPAIAGVSDAGVISTIAVGSVTISASSEGKSGTAALTVIPPPVATIAVALAQSVVFVNASTSAVAVLRDGNGTVLTDRAVAWTSSNASVATVGATGVVTALAAGAATISATSEGRTGAANLTVQLPPVATVTISGAPRVKVGDSYSYTVTLRLGDGTIVNRPISWSIAEAAQASVTQGGVVTPLQVGAFTIRLVIDGVVWTSTYSAYDWEALASSGTQFLVLKADNTITNRSGTVDYSELVVSCGSSGYFFVWVRTPHVITSSGLVAMSFDGGAAFSQTWDELSPSYNTLWKPGSNAAIKSFSLDIASVRVFGFAFGEFLGSSKAMLFRVGGLGPRLPPLFTACPGSAITASAEVIAADLAAQRAVLDARWDLRANALSAADLASRQQSGSAVASAFGLTNALSGTIFASPTTHSQSARRQR
ncbi:MAG: Ig domain-containing protein [Gemmatimonadaceae bacterium]|nr:Ig domain-containing protein [Gemmatimonadaceae bacterium]